MKDLILIAHNLRSAHNVGSLLRTAEGLGISKVLFTGYTPYPETKNDQRLPHIARKISARIEKTSLGAENLIPWEHHDHIESTINNLKNFGYKIIALEQTTASVNLKDFKTPAKLALIVGREAEGIEPEILNFCDGAVEIPMLGKKESFNVAQAAAMALYQFRYG